MLSRLEKLSRLGIEPDALAVLEAYGKTLPRDIKALDEKALAEMKLKAEQLGRLTGRRETFLAKLAPKPEPEPKPKAVKVTRKLVSK